MSEASAQSADRSRLQRDRWVQEGDRHWRSRPARTGKNDVIESERTYGVLLASPVWSVEAERLTATLEEPDPMPAK